MLSFFEITNLVNRDTDAIPLCFQENVINNILPFGLLSDAKCDLLFQTYNFNSDSSSTCMQITMGIMLQIKPAIKYCESHFADTNNHDAIKSEVWTKYEYLKSYIAYCLGTINDSTITNAIGKVTQTQLSNVLMASSLTPIHLFQNFMCAPKSTDKLMVLKKDEQWFKFQYNL